jgi:hypothetical protein
MIGPHEGKELELMRAGEKKLAMFHDYVPEDGTTIAEEIIPEAAFAPYVKGGEIIRIARDITDKRTGDIVRYVCFTLPNEEWRAEAVLWMRQAMRDHTLPSDDTIDIMTGRLLGYSEGDIVEFVDA